ncbi:MAG TPA: hypothetical protein VLD37_03485 [Candidatus Bilamarchaeum sp.]|nr:hypothetical protein [Candidatus Bilamarchaeum sp.]
MAEIDVLVRNAQVKVSGTISALDAAIATWDGMQRKPEGYAETIANMRRLLARLENWERNSLKNSNAPDETKRRDLDALIAISDLSKGDF